MELDVVGGHAVKPTLSVGKRGEHRQRPGAHPLGERGTLEHLADLAVRAVVTMILRRIDDGECCPKSLPHHVLGVEGPAVDAERVEDPPDRHRIGTGVDERTERHVTAHAGEAVEPRRARDRRVVALAQRGVRSIRATAHAAPYPLSIPTTVTPAAHDESMASSAVTPCSDEP